MNTRQIRQKEIRRRNALKNPPMASKLYEIRKVSFREGKKFREFAAPTSRLTRSTNGYNPSFSFLIAKSFTYSYVTSLGSFRCCIIWITNI